MYRLYLASIARIKKTTRKINCEKKTAIKSHEIYLLTRRGYSQKRKKAKTNRDEIEY